MATPATTETDSIKSLAKLVWSHEVAVQELSSLPSSRKVYQKNGTIFFRSNIQQATASEQKHLGAAKAKLQKLNLGG